AAGAAGAAGATGDAAAAAAVPGPMAPPGVRPQMFGSSSTHPYFIEDRLWQQLSPPEQAKVQMQWDRLNAEQRRRVMREIRIRTDSLRTNPLRQPFP
ncbi:MAG: hypothetical protein ACYC3L_09525, partial [Gemmatimonadaceae bacterium]